MDFTVNLGRKIKELRAKQGFSQDSLAERVGISGKYLGQIERGKVNVSAVIVTKIAAAFGLKAEQLFDYDHVGDCKLIREELNLLIASCDDETVRLIYRVVNAIVR